MIHKSVSDFLATGGKATLTKGPVALIFAEDEVEIDSTLRHHLRLGFGTVLAFMPESFGLAEDVAGQIHRITLDTRAERALENTVNRMIKAAPRAWFYYCFNGEYLFYPFCENRTIGE